MSKANAIVAFTVVLSSAALVWAQVAGGSIRAAASRPAASAPASRPASKPASRPAAAKGTWLQSYGDAVKQAQSSGKPILADFTGSDWCGWCKRLKAEVFDTKEFKDWAADKVVLLELDYPRTKQQNAATKKQNSELKEKYSIKGYPTVLFLKSDGTLIGTTGYLKGGAKVWLPNADGILSPPANKTARR